LSRDSLSSAAFFDYYRISMREQTDRTKISTETIHSTRAALLTGNKSLLC